MSTKYLLGMSYILNVNDLMAKNKKITQISLKFSYSFEIMSWTHMCRYGF